MFYLDLGELDGLLPHSKLWNIEEAALFRFCRSDYMGPSDVSLDRSVREAVAQKTGVYPRGPIRMLTHVRQLGYVYNPVTFYYCFDESDQHVEVFIADITNTPWHERFAYIMTEDMDEGRSIWHRYRLQKTFHVSPFMAMNQLYDWRFAEPGDRIVVYFRNWAHDQPYFDASLVLERRPFSRQTLRAAFMRQPLMTAKVPAAIYWQALRLWLRRTPFHPHPKKKGPVAAGMNS
jgi:DUF1365 family protein